MILAPAESKNTPPLASTNPVKTYLYMPCPHSKDSPRFLFANGGGGGGKEVKTELWLQTQAAAFFHGREMQCVSRGTRRA